MDESEVPNVKPLLRIGANGVQPVPYTNHRGETAIRNIMPVTLYWGECEWHKGKQWLLIAWDADKKALRTFSLHGFLEGDFNLECEEVKPEDLPKGAANPGTAVLKPKKKATKRRGNRDSLETD